MAAPLPPIDLSGELEADASEPLDEAGPATEVPADLDPMFAADAAEAFPDLDDAQLLALQRAIRGLMGNF